jgi:hypothetical protein
MELKIIKNRPFRSVREGVKRPGAINGPAQHGAFAAPALNLTL